MVWAEWVVWAEWECNPNISKKISKRPETYISLAFFLLKIYKKVITKSGKKLVMIRYFFQDLVEIIDLILIIHERSNNNKTHKTFPKNIF